MCALFSEVPQSQPSSAYSLRQLLSAVSQSIAKTFHGRYWVVAEIAALQCQSQGHAYLELIEKEPLSQGYRARVKAIIWKDTFSLLNRTFRQVTGTEIQSGMKVMVLVSVQFHEQYGLSLIIHNIEPSYTLGDMERQRRETIERLRRAGILDLNRSLLLALPLHRIAVVSASKAAGYGDFMAHLKHNPEEIPFYTALFRAKMQGEGAPQSIIEALDRIAEHEDLFDVVVIVRGGGATTDLGSFDDYALSEVVAQFPLPILTGIGHDRDQSVVDRVAYRSMKTPTAVADFLVELHSRELRQITQWGNNLAHASRKAIHTSHDELQRAEKRLRYAVATCKEKEVGKLQNLFLVQHLLREKVAAVRDQYRIRSRETERSLQQLRYALAQQKSSRHKGWAYVQGTLYQAVSQLYREHDRRFSQRSQSLLHRILFVRQEAGFYWDQAFRRFRELLPSRLESEWRRIDHYQSLLEMASPKETLKRGFSIVHHAGRSLRTPSAIAVGDIIDIDLYEGRIQAEVLSIEPTKESEK